MGIFNTFKTAETAETGKWFSYSKNDDGTTPRVKLAFMGRTNPRYMSAVEKYSREHQDEITNETLTTEQSREALQDFFLDNVLLGWENLQDNDGNNIEYSRENALALITELPMFYDDMSAKAKRLSNFRAASVEDDAKN